MKSKNSCRVLVAVLSVLMIVATLSPIASVKAASDFHLIIGFDSDYNSSQGHVEYKLDDGSWVSVTEEADIQITDDVTSITFKVVPAEYHEVNFDNGPELDGPVHVSFHAGDAEEARNTLIGSGYGVTLPDSFEIISLTGISFRETTAPNQANISVSIKGGGLEYWEADIPSRITFKLPGIEDFAFGSNNLSWDGDMRPPNATGVSTTNPVPITYDYDNSGTVRFECNISNASTKITSFKINDAEYASEFPQTDSDFLSDVRNAGGASHMATVSFDVPHSPNYEIEIIAEPNDLMGGIGWNYLPEETISGEKREECIAHGTLTFIKGEYDGITYESLAEWNSARYKGTGQVFAWLDGNKNYSDEKDAWGSASFPKGAKITMKLVPDEGYQLISLYGDENVQPENEPGVYTITMTGGMNSHLMATFVSVEDYVKVSASAVTSGNVSNLENTFGEGTMKLNVDNADVSGESISAFEAKAAEEEAEIKEYIDINLANTIYKATDNPDDAWDRAVTELSNPASITLELSNDYSGENIIIIHEHDGQYETIPVTYDSKNNSISFEVAAFSNYAIATVNPEETDPSDEPTEDPSDEPTEDPSDEPKETEEEYSISTTDKKFIVEFTDKKDIPFSLTVIEFLKFSDDELAAMDIPKELFEEMKSQIETLTKPSGKLLGLYEIILIDDNSGGTGGKGPYTLRIKISDELKNYTDFKITELNGFGDEGFTPFAPISLKEVDGYLVAKVDRVGTYAFNGIVRDEQSRTPDSNSDKKPHNGIPATGDNTNTLFWILLLGIASSGIVLTKRS